MARKAVALPQSARPRPGRAVPRHFWIHVILILAIVTIASPLLFALIKATQTSDQVIGPSLLPGTQFLHNLASVWDGAHLGRYMLNSFIVTICVTVGKTILSLLAALAFVYFRFPLKSRGVCAGALYADAAHRTADRGAV